MRLSSRNRRNSRKYGQKVPENATTGGITAGDMRKPMAAWHLCAFAPL